MLQLLGQAGIQAREDDRRGYGYGMFVPMVVIYPQVDVPVLQLSLRSNLNAAEIAPQVTHALIADSTVHRQRGLAELADKGRQARISLSMQVLPETGVILPGQFVRYLGPETMTGIVRSTSISWAAPKLRQTLEVETHA